MFQVVKKDMLRAFGFVLFLKKMLLILRKKGSYFFDSCASIVHGRWVKRYCAKKLWDFLHCSTTQSPRNHKVFRFTTKKIWQVVLICFLICGIYRLTFPPNKTMMVVTNSLCEEVHVISKNSQSEKKLLMRIWW